MGTRFLSPDEAALWAHVMAGVRPLQPKPSVDPVPAIAKPSTGRTLKPMTTTVVGPALRAGPAEAIPKAVIAAPSSLHPKRSPAPPSPPANTLDGRWDRSLSRGLVSPDRTVDLHGHTLHSAHDLLDAALDAAIRTGDRLILLITGKPPRPTSERPHARGAIRAATGDWLAGSRHAAAIAAVRGAHPRHGGAGALYIVLRKPRQPAAASRKS